MSIQLEDVEKIVVAHLTPVIVAFARRRMDDTLPCAVVQCLIDTADTAMGDSDALVQIDILSSAEVDNAEVVCADKATDVHERMIELALNPLTDIVIGTGPSQRTANVTSLTKPQAPIWLPYTDEILRKTARYTIGHEFVAV